MPTLTIELPRPHAGQQAIKDGRARFNVIACGRRFGKTQLGIDLCAEPDALLLLAGGPEQGAREGPVGLLGALDGVRRNRDLVMVDQRGTGDSHPMNCDFPEESWAEADVTAEDFRRLARQCLDEPPGDPRYYTTSIAVRDLDAVRAALGYDRINLYGGSYGTRVAQHYARRYPERVRAMVLDSVVAPELALGASMSIDADAALRAHFARCANDEACAARFPTK